jgi:putative oxidoreductase
MARDIGLLALRIAGLYLAVAHGYGKVVGLATGQGRFLQGVAEMGFPVPIVFAWAAALSEFAGGLLVALGLLTPWAAAFAAFTMVVAALGPHHALSQLLSSLGMAPVPEETLKGWGNPELAVAYLLIMVAVALLGPGRFSIDAWRATRKQGP